MSRTVKLSLRAIVVVVVLASLAVTLWLRSTPDHNLAKADNMAASSSKPTQLAMTLAQARLATQKYVTNLDAAKADGYGIITPDMPGMGYHFLNPKVQGFDITKPPILVYENHGGSWQLGALEWVFPSVPTTPPIDDATFGYFPAACHYVDGNFVEASAQSDCPKTAPKTHAAFNFWHPPLYTLHVWLWYPNPNGLFASTNPLVDAFNAS
jgi:hypothetical protein